MDQLTFVSENYQDFLEHVKVMTSQKYNLSISLSLSLSMSVSFPPTHSLILTFCLFILFLAFVTTATATLSTFFDILFQTSQLFSGGQKEVSTSNTFYSFFLIWAFPGLFFEFIFPFSWYIVSLQQANKQ